METIISWIMTVPKGTMLFSAYGSGKDTVEGKGVHREVKSEGSWM